MIFDRRLFSKIQSSRGFFLLAVIFGWLAGIAVVIQAGVLSRVITAVFLEGKFITELVSWLVGLLGIFINRSLLGLGSEMTAHLASTRIRSHLRRDLVEHIFALGPAYSQGEETGEQVSAAVQGVDQLDAYFSQYIPQLILAGLIPLSVLLVAFPIDWLSGLILLLTAPLIPIFMVLIGQATSSLSRKQFKALGRMSAFLLDTIQGLTTLKLLNQSKAQSRRIAQVSERYYHATMDVLRVAFLSALVLELVGTLSTALIAVQIGLRLLEGGLAFEQAFFVLLLAPEFYLPLRLLGLRFHAAETGRAAAQRIFEIMAIPLPKVEDTPVQIPDGELTISFDKVGFKYPDRSESALEEVTFSLKPGQLTAVVGASGVGKSTLVHLLELFIQPQQGSITVNGMNLAAFSAQTWREKLSWLPQEPHLFVGSIADNLRIAKVGASATEIITAARMAHLDEFIQSLPEGYQTRVGEGGLGLSGGQAQRLGLARAFLAHAPVLVVDEPTAWLDPDLEDALNASLVQLSKERTVMVIAHRLPTIVNADWVVVLADGRVIEQGSVQDLIENGKSLPDLLRADEGIL